MPYKAINNGYKSQYMKGCNRIEEDEVPEFEKGKKKLADPREKYSMLFDRYKAKIAKE